MVGGALERLAHAAALSSQVALALGQADPVGSLAELAVQLHLPMPVVAGRSDGAGQRLQALLVLVARARLAAGHALAAQANIGVGEHLGAGPHDFDGEHVAGLVGAGHFADQREVPARPVQEMQADAAGVGAGEHLAAGQGQADDGPLLASGPKVVRRRVRGSAEGLGCHGARHST